MEITTQLTSGLYSSHTIASIHLSVPVTMDITTQLTSPLLTLTSSYLSCVSSSYLSKLTSPLLQHSHHRIYSPCRVMQSIHLSFAGHPLLGRISTHGMVKRRLFFFPALQFSSSYHFNTLSGSSPNLTSSASLSPLVCVTLEQRVRIQRPETFIQPSSSLKPTLTWLSLN